MNSKPDIPSSGGTTPSSPSRPSLVAVVGCSRRPPPPSSPRAPLPYTCCAAATPRGRRYRSTCSPAVRIAFFFFLPHPDMLDTVIADPGCLSSIRIFSISDPNFFLPGSRIRTFPISDPNFSHPGYASKNLSILAFKIWFLSSSRGQKGPGSATLVRKVAVL